jgi:hypothetical protein
MSNHTTPTSFQDLILAFEFVASSYPGANHAILCRRTGKIYWHSEDSDLDEIDEELPDDIDDDEKYIALPDKRDLGLGKPLALEFAREFLPRDLDDVRDIFGRRGAYPKFKALLVRRRALDRWHAFENAATNQALRDWCKANSIEVSDERPRKDLADPKSATATD